MKIRNISTYIENRGFKEELSKLGTSDEPFLRAIQGDEPNVDTIIEGNASFAQNAEEQLFYEFVQNAYDANAEDLFFFANNDFLVVLNNGKPFYTDTVKQSNGKYKEGQLFNFLARGKSQKHGDKNLMGNYGQGSKLLYTLLCDVGDLRTNEEQLSQKIKKERKGPYLISWSNKRQLDNILYGRKEWEYIDPNDTENGSLICKIVMGYYPLMPGIDSSYFSKIELDSAISAFIDLVDPKRSENRLKQGTALIVPLGNGQCERISAINNLNKVELGLTGFTSLISSSQKYKGANTRNISVLGRTITPHKGESITIEVPIEGSMPQSFSFVFSDDFAINNYVSLYKWLPITTTRYGLGFLIDSMSFDIDDSRQRITNPEKVLTQLTNAFSSLIKELDDIKDNTPQLFNEIYDAIIASKIPDGYDFNHIKKAFDQEIVPFLKHNVRTSDGKYLPLHSVYIPSKTDWDFVDLHKLGIESKHWVSSGITAHYNSIGIGISTLSPEEVVMYAGEDKLKAFVKSLSTENYKLWHEYFKRKVLQNSDLRKELLFKTNNGKIVSYDDIFNSETNLFFYDNKNIGLSPTYTCTPDVEYVVEPLNNISESEAKILYSKIKNSLHQFRKTDALKECCSLILTELVSHRLITKTEARAIALLRNIKGEYTPFNQLFERRPEDVSILDNFLVRGYKPTCVPSDWYVNDKSSVWNWVIKNFESIKKVSDWDKHTVRYIKDLASLYAAAIENNPNITGISLYLDKEGIPCNKETKLLRNFSNITTLEDYKTIIDVFPTINFTPYKFHKFLDSSAFNNGLRKLSIRDIIEEDTEYNIEVVTAFFKFDRDLLRHYWITESSHGYKFHRSNTPKNYVLSESELFADKIHNILSDYNYHPIPTPILNLIDDQSSYRVENQLLQVISDCADSRYFLPLVKKMSNEIKYKYLESLPIIDIKHQIEADAIEWQIIKFVINNYSETYRDKSFGSILKSKLRIDGQVLPDYVQPRHVKVNDHEYDVYRLLTVVKENNQIVETLTDYLPEPLLFVKAFIDTTESWNPKDVYALINPQSEYLTNQQLEFCLDCCTNLKGFDYEEHELKEEENIALMLDIVSTRKFSKFDKYWKIPNFDKYQQVFAERSLLNKEENLPEYIYRWLIEDKSRLDLISNLTSHENPFIQLRAALYRGEMYQFPTDINRNTEILSQTIRWIIAQNFSISWQSKAFESLRLFADKLPVDCVDIPVLRYNGQCESYDDEKGVEHHSPIFQVKKLGNDCSFLNESNTERIGKQLYQHSQFQQYVSSHNLIYPISLETRNRLKINNPIWTVSQQASLSYSEIEWEEPIYIKWKTLHKIKVYLSASPVISELSITSDNKELFKMGIESNDYGYKYNDFVVLHTTSDSGKQVLAHLKNVAEAQLWFRQPFIELQSLHLEWFEQLREEAEKQGVNIEQLIASNNTASDGKSNVDLSKSTLSEEEAQTLVNAIKDPTAIDAISKIADEFTKEELEQISENAELVKDAMQNPDEPESKVRQIIGYIGELIFKLYLENQLKVNYEFSADKGEGRYDFIVHDDKGEDERLYIDVKTNLYSFEEGNYAFHLHRAQNKFIHDNPNAQFRVVRISLKDLNLKKSYERLVDILGKDSDPRTDARVRKECEKIASNYWKRAKIDQFENSSPQYKLAISQVR